MAAVHTIAALLVVMAATAFADSGEVGDRVTFRRWLVECKKDSGISKSKPLYAIKKSIAGLYDPKTRHAFRKTKLTLVKYEFATVRDPSQAEKCLMECLAEKQGMINGSQLDGEMITKVMMHFGKQINLISHDKRVNMTLLKRNTAKCIIGTHGSTETCELGSLLFHCLRGALIQSLYEPGLSTAAPSTWAPTTAFPPTPPSSPMTGYAPQRYASQRYAPQRYAAGAPQMGPPMPQPMAPPMAQPMAPPMGLVPVSAPAGLTPSFVAYRQGAGLLQVYRKEAGPYRPHWRRMHGGQRMEPMI